ncbi:hypothetical protein BDZ91DRAFT_745651, partial [Kalaharituber pfeilii]
LSPLEDVPTSLVGIIRSCMAALVSRPPLFPPPTPTPSPPGDAPTSLVGIIRSCTAALMPLHLQPLPSPPMPSPLEDILTSHVGITIGFMAAGTSNWSGPTRHVFPHLPPFML